MARPRTVNKKIKDLPRGMRKVGTYWYWRGTDEGTLEIATQLKAQGLSTRCGATVIEARAWWNKHVEPRLNALMPDSGATGLIEELLRQYESEDLLAFKRAETQAEYKGRIKRLRSAFGSTPYPKTELDALTPGFLGDPLVQQHLYNNKTRASSANKDIQLLSRIFRIARSRWGKTSYNPCEKTEYLPEFARDVYVADDKYQEIHDAGNEQFQCMARISYQTGARIGSVYTISLAQITEPGLVIRIGKKKNGKGYVEQVYTWSPDLRSAVDAALALRERACGTPEKHKPDGALFLTQAGKPYTKEAYKSAWARVRKKLGLKSREITVHDLGRAKAISDSDSDEAGQKLAGHDEIKTTIGVYRRKQKVLSPIPAVKKQHAE